MNQDFLKAIDFTGRTFIDPVELNQLIEQASPASDRGFVLTTFDANGVPAVPNPDTYPKLERYFWRRVSATNVTAYVWNPLVVDGHSGTGLLKWVSINSATIGIGGVTAEMLAGGIPGEKILNIPWSKVSGVPVFISEFTAFPAGDVTGNYNSGLSIGVNKVTTTKILDGSVTPAKLSAQVALAVVQRKATNFTNSVSTTVVRAADTNALSYVQTDNISYSHVSITPKHVDNILVIRFRANVSGDASLPTIIAALFIGDPPANGDAPLVTALQKINVTNSMHTVALDYQMIAGVTTPLKFRIGWAVTAGTGYMNSNSVNFFGGNKLSSLIEVVEYLP